jgi:hypothetical protein
MQMIRGVLLFFLVLALALAESVATLFQGSSGFRVR